MNRTTLANSVFAWSDVDTVMLDMDGTLLDKYFDDFFWEKYVPQAYASQNGIGVKEAENTLLKRYKSVESTLQWTDLDFWSEGLGLDIVRLKREITHLIAIHAYVIDFLKWVRAAGKELHLVTNAHPKTLKIKLDKTGLAPHFDKLICSADIGAAKEEEDFWCGLEKLVDFDKERTMFADDTIKVLASARRYGIAHLVHVARPSSKLPTSYASDYLSIADFGELLPPHSI